MCINLYPHQRKVLDKLKNGSILQGGVGSGKSLTSIAYFFKNICGGDIELKKNMKSPIDLYIITTAMKRDKLDWDKECSNFILSRDPKNSIGNIKVTIDSWNNIKKYTNVKNSFFIFDEQRVVGSGVWVKSFLKITKKNKWILLTATPGDTWLDYIPVFIANGFYKNRTEFKRTHVIYNPYTPYPKVQRYLNTNRLEKYRRQITVEMKYKKHTKRINKRIKTIFDKNKYSRIINDRWDIYEDKPIQQKSKVLYLLRRVVNSDPSRIDALKKIINEKDKAIIFYNFNYELDILREVCEELKLPYSEWNGHKHEPIPDGDKWVYLVQYTAGAEGWNCVETNVIIFYSQNYSYKTMVQSCGRIDRLNTPYTNLYYYHLVSSSSIDFAISKALKNKKNFNERAFLKD